MSGQQNGMPAHVKRGAKTILTLNSKMGPSIQVLSPMNRELALETIHKYMKEKTPDAELIQILNQGEQIAQDRTTIKEEIVIVNFDLIYSCLVTEIDTSGLITSLH